jgi:hypothetical protein
MLELSPTSTQCTNGVAVKLFFTGSQGLFPSLVSMKAVVSRPWNDVFHDELHVTRCLDERQERQPSVRIELPGALDLVEISNS